MKQSRLRRKRVFRYAVLYFVMLIVFVGLIVGPLVAGKKIPASVTRSLDSTNLIQPTGLDNNDTLGFLQTGTGRRGYPTSPVPTNSQGSVSNGNSNNNNNNNNKNRFRFF